jgi:hypothetical protein
MGKAMRGFLAFVAISLFLSASALCGEGTQILPFLTMDYGGRPSGMGGAYVAVADDVNAVVWNPAGILQVRRPQFSAMHNVWFGDVSGEFLGLALPMGRKFAMGVGVLGVFAPNVERRSGPTEEPEGTFLAFSAAGMFLAALEPMEGLMVGAAVKAISENYGDWSGSGWALDLGALLSAIHKILPYIPRDLSVGVAARNVGFNSETPSSMSLGVAYRPSILGRGLVLSSDLERSSEGLKLRVGGEGILKDRLAIRVGYEGTKIPTSLDGFTGGIGLIGEGSGSLEGMLFRFDYAASFHSGLGVAHKVSATMTF